MQFHPKLNYIYGKNGSGKTNLIESIYFLTNLKSFRTKKRTSLIKDGFGNMYIKGDFYKDSFRKDLRLSAVKQVRWDSTHKGNLKLLLSLPRRVLATP